MVYFLKRNITLLIGLLLIVLAVILWINDSQNDAKIVFVSSLFIFFIKHLFDRHSKNIDTRIENQNQINLQKSQGGIAFKQNILEEMYNVTMELWKQSIWIGNNWNALWPGNDNDIEKKKEFKSRFYKYKEYLQTYSINIPSQINDLCKKLINGIVTYEVGRDRKEGKWGFVDDEEIIKGGADMSTGADMVKEAISELFSTIRKEFGISDLTEELLDIKQPE